MENEWTKTDYCLHGDPIIITTLKTKVRHHKKRRIQKKWAKQQLFFDFQHDGEVVFKDGYCYMNERTFNQYRELSECGTVQKGEDG